MAFYFFTKNKVSFNSKKVFLPLSFISDNYIKFIIF